MTALVEGMCAACGATLQPGARFCDSCGAPTAPRTCAACGEALTSRARFCPECGTPSVPPPSSARDSLTPVVAERRVTSVLFGDLVGFTPLSENRDAEDIRELLSGYFRECRTIVGRYGGTVEKFIGDAVMAVWGVPVAHEDDAERAVRAGLELAQAIACMGEDISIPDLAMRVGVVTGEVAVTVGATAEGMVAGDAVNTASRVQATARPGEVWVDDTTRSLTLAAIAYDDEGGHALKGKAEQVHLWRARDVVAAVGGGQRVDGLEAPLTGRDRDLRLLKELFHATEETGQPRLLVLDGEPGVGKSRLAWEFEKYVDGLTASVWWHRGRCLSYGDGAAFWALSEAVRGRLGLVESDTGIAIGDRLERWLTECVADETERDWLRPRVFALLGETVATTFAREDLFSAWTAFFERVGCGDPVVLVIDDAQHADDSLLDFIDHLLSTARFGVFVLAIARPELLERRPGLGGRRASIIRLNPLDDVAMGTLVDGLVQGLSPDARAMLVARAEGIPLFAVETVRALIDRDAVIPRSGRYVAADGVDGSLEALGAPASLQALVAARLDALTPNERRVVTDASVLGLSFTRDGLVAVDRDIVDLDDVLAALQRREILGVVQDRRSAERGQYTFVQGVVRQVAYATQSKRDRKARHLAAAAYLEGLVDESEDLSIVVAQHLLDAVAASSPGDADRDALTARACDHLERAAQRAAGLAAPAEACRLYGAALACTADPVDEARMSLASALAAKDAGDYQRLGDQGRRAAELFDEMGDSVNAGIATAEYAWAVGLLTGWAEAIDIAEARLASLGPTSESERAEVALVSLLSNAYYNVGDWERASIHLQRRLLLAEAMADPKELAASHIALGHRYLLLGAPVTADAITQSGADIARDNDLTGLHAQALNNLASTQASRDLAAALESGRQGMEAARRSGNRGFIDFTTANYSLALWSAGRLAEARAIAHEAGDSVVIPGLWGLLAAVDAWTSDALGVPPSAFTGDDPSDDVSARAWASALEIARARADGDLSPVASRLEEALGNVTAANGVDDDFAFLWPPLVETALAVGDLPMAERLFAPAAAAAPGTIAPAVRAHLLRLRGLIGAARGDDAALVEADLRAGIAALDDFGAVGLRARAEEDLGRWLLSVGRITEASDLMESARATYEQIGALGWLARLDAAALA